MFNSLKIYLILKKTYSNMQYLKHSYINDIVEDINSKIKYFTHLDLNELMLSIFILKNIKNPDTVRKLQLRHILVFLREETFKDCELCFIVVPMMMIIYCTL